jgi:hypothetical protein
MPWTSLGVFNLSKSWGFTIPVTGEIFRIKHFFINNQKKEYLKGAIAQGFQNEGLNIFDTRRLTYREEMEIFNFSFPVGLESHSLFFKRLDDSLLNWTIKVEIFSSTSIEQDFMDYLKQRFGDFMPLFSRTVIPQESEYFLYTSSNSGEKELEADKVKMILPETAHRRTLSLQNKSAVQICIGTAASEEDNLISQEVILLQPNEYYEFPTAGNEAYTGMIWAKAPADCIIHLNETIREKVANVPNVPDVTDVTDKPDKPDKNDDK